MIGHTLSKDSFKNTTVSKTLLAQKPKGSMWLEVQIDNRGGLRSIISICRQGKTLHECWDTETAIKEYNLLG